MFMVIITHMGEDFESPASTIPPLGHAVEAQPFIESRRRRCVSEDSRQGKATTFGYSADFLHLDICTFARRLDVF